MPLNFLSSAINAGINSQMHLNQMMHEERLQKSDQAYNERMWNMQNEYNSPVQQMARLREAGINPATSFGQIASGAISKSPPYTRHNPVARPPQIQIELPNVLGIMSQLKQLKGQELDNERRSLENSKIRTENLYYADYLDARNKIALNEIAFKYGLQPYQIKNLQALTARTQQEYDYNKEVNPIRLQSWKTFGTESVPWYAKTGNTWIDDVYNYMMSNLQDIGKWDLKTWFKKAEEARAMRRGQKSFFSE